MVSAAHPTIAPLILYVAREFPIMREQEPSVLVYLAGRRVERYRCRRPRCERHHLGAQGCAGDARDQN